MTQFESKQAAWEYYLNLDSHNFEEKQHNNIYTDAFEAGAEAEHKRLVEKACEWLENHFVCFLQGAKRGIYSNQFATVKDMVDNFKRIMEEQL